VTESRGNIGGRSLTGFSVNRSILFFKIFSLRLSNQGIVFGFVFQMGCAVTG